RRARAPRTWTCCASSPPAATGERSSCCWDGTGRWSWQRAGGCCVMSRMPRTPFRPPSWCWPARQARWHGGRPWLAGCTGSLAWSRGVVRSMSLRKTFVVVLAVASLVLAGVGVARHRLGAAASDGAAAPPASARPKLPKDASEDRRAEVDRARAELEKLRRGV